MLWICLTIYLIGVCINLTYEVFIINKELVKITSSWAIIVVAYSSWIFTIVAIIDFICHFIKEYKKR